MTTNNDSNFFPTVADSSQNFAPGQKVLNRYTLERVLGQGGMGIVWLAQDEDLDLKVALKFLPALVINDRASLNDLKRETRRSLELTHPHIVRTYDFLQDGNLAGISMEYVDSDTLRNRRIDQPTGVFQTADLGEWTVQLCDALDYAHKTASIIHRDLKPANLLVNRRNHLKIADFGISRSLVESVTQVTGGNAISGTLVYMSPQQLEGDPAQPLDDIYAVGATLYELCTSRPPFFTGDISRQVHLKVPPAMADRRTELGIPHGEMPENWETTVAACLAKDPMHRPQSAGEIAVRLGLREAASISTTATTLQPSQPVGVAVRGFAGMPPTHPPSPAHAPGTGFGLPVGSGVPGKHKSWVPLTAAATAMALAIFGSVWLFGSRHEKQPKDQSKVVENGPAASTAAKYPEATAASQAAEAARLANARGSIFVESDPPGARVKVDDRPAEKTPVPLKDLTLGAHSLKMMMDGYEDYSAQVDVKENQTTDVGKIKLVRSIGWLTVTTTPPGAEITIKGPDGPLPPARLTSPWNSDKLPTGDYEVTSTRPGWVPVTKKVSLTKDQALPVAFDLSGGSVLVTSVPTQATVLLDGKPVGKTPYSVQDAQPGDIQYSLAFAGYTGAVVQGKIEQGRSLNLDAKLTKLAGAPRPTGTVHSVASTRTTSRSRRSSGGGDDGDPHRGEDGIDKASRVGHMLQMFNGLPHP